MRVIDKIIVIGFVYCENRTILFKRMLGMLKILINFCEVN